MTNDKIVSVVASGHSVMQIDVSRIPGTIIGVNETALHLPRVDHIVTMDRLWTENRWIDVQNRYGRSVADRAPLEFWVRRSAFQNIMRDITIPRWTTVFENEITGSMSPPDQGRGILNGSSSGMCAVNLALKLKPQVVYLFGFDMQPGPNGEPYWHEPHPWARPSGGTSSGRFKEWREHFKDVAESFTSFGVHVYNVSGRSALEQFPVLFPREIGVQKE